MFWWAPCLTIPGTHRFKRPAAAAPECENPTIRYIHPDIELGQFVNFDGATYQMNKVLQQGVALCREASPIGIGALLQKLEGLKGVRVTLVDIPIDSEDPLCYLHDPYGEKDKNEGRRWIGSLCWGEHRGMWYQGRVTHAAYEEKPTTCRPSSALGNRECEE